MEIIEKTSLCREVEPLRQSFGFKGGALTELWQVSCRIVSDSGHRGTGLGVQSVLWSDSGVFARYGQQEGNRLMLAVTEYALECLRGRTLTDPPGMMSQLIPEVMEYARKLTGEENLRTTFVLNALTPVDWALWQLYADRKNCHCLARLAEPFTTRLNQRQSCLGNIPLISYDTTEEEIRELADKGRFLFKIKIGSNPGGRNRSEEMLTWDVRRIEQIHRLLGEYSTPWTECGHPVYYLDANGRYDTLEQLERLLNGADACGALPRIVLLEEPFAEDQLQNVREIPVTVAADESAHSAEDACVLIEEYGYGAIALKPVAKTLSVSLDVLEEAGKRGVPCFCADLTVNPSMVEYNKIFAAHLDSLPGLKAGVVESNGSQNYQNWEKMCRTSPAWGKSWAEAEDGMFYLNEEYYASDGGIWQIGGEE